MLSEIQLFVRGHRYKVNIWQEDAADILQESLLILFNKEEEGKIRYVEDGEIRTDKLQTIEILNEDGTVKDTTTDNAYLVGIIKMKMKEFHRKVSKKREREGKLQDIGGDGYPVDVESEAPLDGKTLREFFRYAIQMLSRQDRLMVFASHFTDLSNEELAELFPHLTEASLRVSKSRANARFQKIVVDLAKQFGYTR